MFKRKNTTNYQAKPEILDQQIIGKKKTAEEYAHVTLSSPETEAQLDKKIHDLDVENFEKEAHRRAEELGLPYIDLRKIPISQEAITVLSEEQSLALQAVVFLNIEDTLRIATTNPNNPQLQAKIQELKEKYGADVKMYFVSDQSLQVALDKFSRIPKVSESIVGGLEITEDELKKWQKEFTTFEDLQDMLQKAVVTDVVTMVISAALKIDASDVHIEAEENDVKIRFRVDGVLHDVASLGLELWPKLIARIKLLARIKLNISTKPQDGRFTIFVDNRKTEVRTSTVPTTYGESIVMRILRSGVETFNFKNLGLRGKAFNDLLTELKKPNGMIISTGPTGSGKTTTLYAMLNLVNNSEKMIITLEDPVEYKIPGINQSQISVGGSYNFAEGLRSILRQDPDIIMVGEVRDLETAEVAINAALTGHLMFTTMHTNSAAGAVPRLLAMGVKPYLLAPAINAIEAQRLVRKLCEKCKTKAELDNNTTTLILNELNKIAPESGFRPEMKNELVFHTAPGCPACNGLGYKGRIGLFEVLTMSQEIEKIILAGNVSEYELEALAIKGGMITMLQDGILKALDGITSIEEVLKRTE